MDDAAREGAGGGARRGNPRAPRRAPGRAARGRGGGGGAARGPPAGAAGARGPVRGGYGSYEQYEDVAERLSEIRVSASMLPAAGAAAQRMAAMRAALREVPVPPQYPTLTVVYLRLIGEFLDKIVRHPDYISLAADEVQPSTEGYNDILNALWH